MFAPQTDFKKLKRFLYKYMFDDEFRQLPYNGMKDIILQETIISNPTITNYVRKIYQNNMIGIGEPNYYSINKRLGTYTPITEKQYKEAWRLYWEARNEGAEYQPNMMEAIDFTPKIGMNIFMIEFEVPKYYYDSYYNHRDNEVW